VTCFEKEAKNFKRNATEDSKEAKSKGEKIKKIQKVEEEKRDIHNKEKPQAEHPSGQQESKEDGPENKIKKVAVSESLTAGKVADLLASHQFAGSFFIGSISVYTLKHKSKLLGVEEDHADDVDCVSPKVCEEMAQGVLKMFSEEAEVGVGVTGFAKTDGVEDLHPHAYYCVITKGGDKREGKIEEGLDGKSRNEVRRIVAERVYLETCKVIGLEPDKKIASRHKDSTLEEEKENET